MSGIKQEFIMPIVVLTVICIVTSAALAATQQVTAPIIEQAEKSAAEAARMEVLPQADIFEPIEAEGVPEGVREIYKANNGTGFVVIAGGKGYGGDIKVIVGIREDGKINKTKILSHSETAGLGSKTADEPFQKQFEGKDDALEGVDVISGATISSKSVMSIVKDAYDAYLVASGGGYENPVGLTQNKLQQYYPNADAFEEKTKDGIRYIDCGGEGYVVFGEGEGYGGTMTVAVLFGPNDKTILGVVLDSHNETPGLGSQTAKKDFTDRFRGRNGVDGIDDITSATESSKGFKKAVSNAIAALDLVKGA
jgi:electron transport complex protein RnfG